MSGRVFRIAPDQPAQGRRLGISDLCAICSTDRRVVSSSYRAISSRIR